jgi:multidrug efflux pump subunit AcrA (membrane-fusion protein)
MDGNSMDEEEKGLYTVAEAAEAWGITRQAVYKRLSTMMTTDVNHDDNQVDKLTTGPLVVVKGRTRYITREGLLFFMKDDSQVDNQVYKTLTTDDNQVDNLTTEVDNQVDNLTTEVDNLKQAVNSLKEELNQARTDLLAEQGRASTLQATVDAQQAHIDSLKTALDREQALHMASLQKRLPAPGKGFFAALKGKKGEE